MSGITLKKSDVFISYGRKESKNFAANIHDALVNAGYDVWFDQNDIPLAIDFQSQIDEGIRKANNFIFVIAPHALKSPYCLKEIQLAVKLNKRIIPILHIEPTERVVWEMMHPTISKLNWIYFRQKADYDKPIEQWTYIDNFDTAFNSLCGLLNTHKEYVNKHTEILINAIEWDRSGREPTFLLMNKERLEAEEWLAKVFDDTLPPCSPTFIHCEYICESKKSANNMMTDVYFCFTQEFGIIHDKIRNSLTRYGITSWTAKSDLRTTKKLKDALRSGIEQADNFVFFITPQTVNSLEKLEEFDIAVKYRKRIIPLLIQDTNKEDLPPRLSTMNKLNFISTKREDFVNAFGKLLYQIKYDREYSFKHKILLSKAIKWEKQKRNPSILLRGYELENAKTWLKLGLNRNQKPTPLHKEFIKESENKIDQSHSEVYISYSEYECDFASRIHEYLLINGKTTWFDHKNIASTVNYRKEITKGIDDSNNIIFIISPESLECAESIKDLEYAVSTNKRIIPILYKDVPSFDVPNSLNKIQWIDFLNNSFEAAYSDLIRTIDNDREYVQRHTNLLIKAKEWKIMNAITPDETSMLLRGAEYILAKEWLNEALEKQKKPAPAQLVIDYMSESKRIIEEQLKKEELQQSEMLKLQQERAKEAEKNLELQKKHSRRQRQWIVAISFAFFTSVIAAVFAGYFWGEANKNLKEANTQREIAETMKTDAERSAENLKEQLNKLEIKQNELNKKSEEVQKYQKNIQQKNRQYNDALNEINKIEKEQSKIENSNLELEEKERQLKLIQLERMEQKSVILTHESEKWFNKDPKKSFRLGEYAYRYNENNERAYGAYLNAYYKVMPPSLITPGHNERVISACYAPQRDMIVTASWDKTARISTPEGKTIAILKGHSNVVNYASFSPDGSKVITASNKSVKIWNIKGSLLKTLRLHNDVINTAEISPSGQYILTSSSDKTVKIHNMSGKLLKSINFNRRVNSAHYSANGNKIITADDDGKVTIYDITNDTKVVHKLMNEVISSACFSPDGRFILTGSWDSKVRLYNLKRELIAEFDETDKKITTVAFSKDQKYIVVSHRSETIHIMPIDVDLLSKKFTASTAFRLSNTERAKYKIDEIN